VSHPRRTLARISGSAVAACLAALWMCAPALAQEKLLHSFGDVSMSPDGSRVVSVESDNAPIEGEPTRQDLVIRPVDSSAPHVVALPCAPDPDCVPSSPTWSPDSTTFVFVLRSPKSKTRMLYEANPDGGMLTKILAFDGTLGAPSFSPAGKLAVLATAAAKKEIGATQAGAPIVGEIGTDNDEQRIAIVTSTGTLAWASPPDTFVYEYDWKPDGSGFVGTAAPGNGDNNYWVAKLYAFDAATARATLLYTPASPQQQLAHPLVSPDGNYVAFIGGLMSDFGSTGGEIYVLPARGGAARDVTPAMTATATTFRWECPNDPNHNRIYFGALEAGERQLRYVSASGNDAPALLRPLGAAGSFPSRACDKGDDSATIVQDFEKAPEIFIGRGATLTPLTHVNAGIAAETNARSVTWTNDGHAVQGWLLAPLHANPAQKHPMIVMIHGGPAAAWERYFIGRGVVRELLRNGYYLFAPNPRGSFGEGEAFTLGNVKDFGYGDLRDDLAGVDAVERIAPIDDKRLGITGGSYGGFMTMWAVTQTNRFKAAVGGAGISNWISYYGENGIDEWMIPYFGASAYDDPAPYRRSSPIDFIKNVKTPTFAFVGERDVECPAPQSQEFWHALETLGVPTQLVIYEGEGHGIRSPAHRADVTKRTLAWFARYLGPSTP
jgi:dipeptidyl aminopeptidase/acylaminoacyl peptidase